MNPQRLQSHLAKVGLITCLVLFFHLVGCGSKTDKPTVVPPPSSQESPSTTDAAPSTEGPPGGLEMPPEDALKQPPADEPGSGGLELPDEPISDETPKETAKIQYATWEEIEAFATSRGRVTVVDIWSTSCPPCLKEFPGLVKLHKQQGDSIQCISVDVDYFGGPPPETYEQNIVAVLTSMGADFPNYVSRTPSEDIFEKLDVISIPTVLIFGADGKLVKKFVDANETAGFTYEKDIIPLVTKLAG